MENCLSIHIKCIVVISRSVFTVFMLLLLASCLTASQAEQSTVLPRQVLVGPQPTLEIAPKAPTQTPQRPAPTEGPTPTARIFATPGNCANEPGLGHILYIGGGLSLMDGSGCHRKLLLKDARNSPKWSPDGRMIAVACEFAKVCLLDVASTLDTCSGPEEEQICQPAITARYDICQSENCSIDALDWSMDMSSLAIAYNSLNESNQPSKARNSYSICILNLNTGSCQDILVDKSNLWVDWSPVENRLAVSNHNGEVYLVNPDGSNREDLAWGGNPVWSPDGKKIAFHRPGANDDLESLGIGSIDVQSRTVEWLYSPAPRDRHYWPPQNIGVGCGNIRGLSWSPDGKYIAFTAGYNIYMFACYVLRLDIAAQTVMFYSNSDGMYYGFDPDWGP